MNGATLRSYLVQEKRPVACNTKSDNCTRDLRWKRGRFAVWDDFNLFELNQSYGHLLDLVVDGPNWHMPPTIPYAPDEVGDITINKEKDINHLIIWNAKVLSTTVRFAKRVPGFELHPGIETHHEHSTPEKQFKTKGTSNGLHVDHIVSLNTSPQQTLVVGLGRTSRKFSGTAVVADLAANKDPLTRFDWTLRQLGNLCASLNTRYGYIQTDQELVVCCFSKLVVPGPNGSAVGEQHVTQIKPIKWTVHGEQNLTTDLALWWLCMLAMAEDPTMVSNDQLVKINHWHDNGLSRTHHYSKAEYSHIVNQIDNNTIINNGNNFLTLGNYDNN